MLRLFRIVINSFALVLLLMLSVVFSQFNLLFAFLLALSAFDQFEDVYYYVYGVRLIPSWFMFFDIVFELVLIFIGVIMFSLSFIYYYYFPTWFFRVLFFISILIVYSAIEDLAYWIRVKRDVHSVCSEKEVCEKEYWFIRRK